MARVDCTKIADALNISARRIQQLVHEGMPREARGSYDLGKCMLWYIRYLQRALERKAIIANDGEQLIERAARIRLLQAEAGLKEIELAREQGSLISLSDMEQLMTALVVDTRGQILTMGARLAPELVGETSRLAVQTRIENFCKQILEQLAKRARPDGPIAFPGRKQAPTIDSSTLIGSASD